MQRRTEKKDSYLKFRKSPSPPPAPLPRCLNLTFLSWQKFMLNKVSQPPPSPRRDVHVYSAMHNNLFHIASLQKQENVETQLLTFMLSYEF